MKSILYLSVAALLATPAIAQDDLADFLEKTEAETVEAPVKPEPITLNALRDAGGTPPSVIDGPDQPEVVEELQARGIQGQPVVKFIVQPDGSVTDVAIERTSQSDELDQVALDLTREMVVEPGKDADGNAVAVATQMPFNFWKDSMASGQLFKKTCADYVIDADWFLAKNPDKALNDMRLWKLTLGTYVVTHKDGFRAKHPKPQDVYDNCAAKPKAKFFKTFEKSV